MGQKTESRGDTVPLAPQPPKSWPTIQAGQGFGHYRVIRPIGGGGMGAVYEAEDLDTSRRVAIKLLSHKLDSPEARERFFREGRLAASINHPNSVYIFGTEEVAGTPVISMELLSGGTLQDVVHKRGPMRPGDAVDAILQIIEGLEAAQKSGILHRDIKPSNCFVDSNGTIKIGDFGLSISTAVRTEPALTADGAFLGTPAFCPPEQLRGEELNVRSDIYSVGATLFYLLTGRTPFEAQNVVALIATVLEKPSPSPRDLRPDVSDGLAKIVQRCLHKVRGDRYANYAELRRALEPFSSAAPVPAPLGLRFVAGCLDVLALNLAIQAIVLGFFGGLGNLVDVLSRPDPKALLYMAGCLFFSVLYYAVFEGFFGAAAGKAICGLRVVRPNRNLPGFWRAGGRALLYTIVPLLPFWITSAATHPGGLREFLSSPKLFVAWPDTGSAGYYFLASTPYVVMALMFLSARRRNGFRAVHDFATNTQVIARSHLPPRASMVQTPEPAVPAAAGAMVGPYRVLETLAEEPGCRWLVGFDLRLLRKVWIRQLPPGTAPFPINLRNLGRPTRLRWLTGKRSESESWDAFEAPGGQPFVAVAGKPQSWDQVRFWLWDLAQELAAAQRDHNEPAVLALDRVWLTADGKPKLLDFPAPGVRTIASPADPEAPPATLAPEAFLARFAVAALKGDPASADFEIPLPLPLHARQFVSDVRGFTDLHAAIDRLGPLLNRAASVSRLRRAMILLGCVAFPLISVGMGILGKQFLDEFHKRRPGLLELNQVLAMRSGMRFVPAAQRISDDNFSVFIASQYRSFITNEGSWNDPFSKMLISGESRVFAEKSVVKYPDPTPEEVARAEKAIKPAEITRVNEEIGGLGSSQLVFAVTLLVYVCIPALIAALLFRGGMALFLARIVFVKRDGTRASRLRVFWRAIVAWLPLGAAMAGVSAALALHKPWLGLLGIALMAVLAAVSLAMRDRGLQDRLAGTWPVLK